MRLIVTAAAVNLPKIVMMSNLPFHVRLANVIMDVIDFTFKAMGWMTVVIIFFCLGGMYIVMWLISLGFVASTELWPTVADLRWWFVTGNSIIHFMIILSWAESHAIRPGK